LHEARCLALLVWKLNGAQNGECVVVR
jgi:hypothetical protein